MAAARTLVSQVYLSDVGPAKRLSKAAACPGYVLVRMRQMERVMCISRILPL